MHRLQKTALCAIALSIPALSAQTSPKIIPSFYTTTSSELTGKPGTMLRTEPITTSVPQNSSAYRILYRSTGLHGEPIAVSAVLVIPAGEAPTQGRPIVAWSHPTSGVDQPCAPSLSPSVLQMIPGLSVLLRHGYAVVATDYPGLGTTGPHPYLSIQSEGHAVLDAVRAAHNLPQAHAGTRFALWGHSQGGHASLSAASLAHTYAPDLKLVGVAAAAPATDLTKLAYIDTSNYSSELMGAMLLRSWSRVYNISLDPLLSSSDMPNAMLLARQCFDPPIDNPRQPSAAPLPMVGYKMKADVATSEPWHTLLLRNSPGTLPPGIPVFLAQGSADATIPPSLTSSYKDRLCHAGSSVHMVTMPGVSHLYIARDAESQAVAWISDRFDNKPAPSDCSK